MSQICEVLLRIGVEACGKDGARYCSAFLSTQMKIETMEPSQADVLRTFLQKEGKSLR